MFKNLFKKNENAAAAATELTQEQINAALEKEAKRLRRKATAKKVLKNTFNGVCSAVVGIIVYKVLEDRFGSSAEGDTITTTPTTTDGIDCNDYIAADAATDYTSLEEV